MDDRLTNEGEIKELDNPIYDEYDELHEKYESLLEELVRRIEKITELRIIIEKAITYCEESSKTIKSEYFSDVLKILKGEE